MLVQHDIPLEREIDALRLPQTFVVVIPGIARGKERAKVAVRGKFARAYTPQQTVNAEAWVRACCVDQVGSPCLLGPVSIDVGIEVAVAPSWSKRKTADALSGAIRPTGKPDLDNIVKLLADALNGVLWQDDAQIVEMSVRKFYAERPMTTLTVSAA